jgi:hypothetical protein
MAIQMLVAPLTLPLLYPRSPVLGVEGQRRTASSRVPTAPLVLRLQLSLLPLVG